MPRSIASALITSVLFLPATSAICFAQEGANAAQEGASVQGHVFTKDGRPAKGVNVTLFPLYVGTSGPVPHAVTDKDGFYAISCPPFGQTRLIAVDEGAGFPDTSMAIFHSEHAPEPEVVLSANTHLRDVDIHLPNPDGSLEGQVVDDITGETIASGHLVLSLPDDPSVIYATGIMGAFRFDLPDKKITLAITAGGYKPYRFVDPLTGNPYLDLKSYEHKRIMVRMVPAR